MIEPDTDATLWDLDWSLTDEELAQLIGRDTAVVAELRRRVFSAGDGRRGKWMKPPPEVIELWREEARHHTVAELAVLWGLTPEGAHARLERHGIESLGWSRGERRGRPRMASETVEQWRREAALHTADELARMWGVAENTVFSRAQRHGFSFRARPGRRTPERVVERWRRQARGRTVTDLAALWGVPYSTAWGRARRFGLPVKRREPRVRSRTRARPRRDVERMRREAEGRTVKELAVLWGVSRQRAHQLVKKHSLPAEVRRRKPRLPPARR